MSKKIQILNLLSDGQAHSAKELIAITHRFSAAIHTLREQGHNIETIPMSHNEFVYQLMTS
jgi:hypothetical protein